ncbi:hypothetical protein VSU19_14555 [Verrucomicrobiales bacterium BCK34]|nr:hypothetical protein [Verrucomicrobiales bacterium BCK34]
MEESDSTPPTDNESWYPDLLQAAGLTKESSLNEIQEKTGELADAAAPKAQSSWIWIILIQFICVVAPTLWLVRRGISVSTSTTAVICFVAVLLFVGALWWLRWRGMQRTWARARLVSEVARAISKGNLGKGTELLPFLAQIPSLQTLSQMDPPDSAPGETWREKKARWIEDRLEDQLAYFQRAKAKADHKRAQFTRSTTLLMDVTLSLSLFALIIFMIPGARIWHRYLGDYWLEIALGLGGLILPLALTSAQILRSSWDLNRRSARYARQIRMLENTRERLSASEEENEDLSIIRQAEQQLLGEVVDWFFETETAEQFLKVRKEKAIPRESGKIHALSKPSKTSRAVAGGSIGAAFLFKILFGRLPWILGTAAFTFLWVALKAPSDDIMKSNLTGSGQILNASGTEWNPDPLLADNGCIIIAHGLHDSYRKPPADGSAGPDEYFWMWEMQKAIKERFGVASPNIALVDWHAEAKPTNTIDMPSPHPSTKFVQDVVAIRAQGQEVGDYLAFRIAQRILNGEISRDAPLHLIGHSAGGFVVSRAALKLKEYRIAPKQMHVTILDTPEPDKEIKSLLPKLCDVDFYITSSLVQIFDKLVDSSVHLKRIKSEEKLGFLEAHSYAYKWYISTIADAEAGEDGFGRSPFAR